MPNKLELRRQAATEHRVSLGWGDARREKRMGWRFMTNPVYDAYTWGEGQAYRRKPIANPYPPGRRHDAFALGVQRAFDD